MIGFDSSEPMDIDQIATVKFRYADSITDPVSLCTLDVQKLETVDENGAAQPVDPSSVSVSKYENKKDPDYDINSDGSVNTKDLLNLIKMIIDKTMAKKVTADLNGDGHLNAEDVITMKKHSRLYVKD